MVVLIEFSVTALVDYGADQMACDSQEDPSSLSADERARAEQLLARDARKAAKKAARRVSSETPSPGTA